MFFPCSHCPAVLALHVAHAVVDGLRGIDLTQFQEPPGEGLEGVGYGTASRDGAATTPEEMEHEDKVKEEREHLKPRMCNQLLGLVFCVLQGVYALLIAIVYSHRAGSWQVMSDCILQSPWRLWGMEQGSPEPSSAWSQPAGGISRNKKHKA